MQKLILFMTCGLLVVSSFAQDTQQSERRVQLVLNDGRTVEGDLVRVEPGVAVVLQDDNGNEKAFPLKLISTQRRVTHVTRGQNFGNLDFSEPDIKLTSEQMSVYETQKKSPGSAAALSILVSSAGHAYAGEWSRGLRFTAGRLGLAVLALTAGVSENVDTFSVPSFGGPAIIPSVETSYNPLFYIGIGGAIALGIWEAVDASRTVNNYNENLKSQIAFKAGFSFDQEGQPRIRLTYHF